MILSAAICSPRPSLDEDHHVSRHAAGEVCGNRLRPYSLRRTRSARDLDAARPLEFRQPLLVRASESAGYQNVHCADPHFRKPSFRRGQADRFAVEPNVSLAPTHRLWRTRRPSASLAHRRSGGQF
jgi:hypothetical protein